eukprot:scaffold702_cov350-Pinguiococcus_pyrenoidosus.AAC.3
MRRLCSLGRCSCSCRASSSGMLVPVRERCSRFTSLAMYGIEAEVTRKAWASRRDLSFVKFESAIIPEVRQVGQIARDEAAAAVGDAAAADLEVFQRRDLHDGRDAVIGHAGAVHVQLSKVRQVHQVPQGGVAHLSVVQVHGRDALDLRQQADGLGVHVAVEQVHGPELPEIREPDDALVADAEVRQVHVLDAPHVLKQQLDTAIADAAAVHRQAP